jgi:uridylate kinase
VKPAYRRILLKLSGEVLAGSKAFGTDCEAVNQVTREIVQVHQAGVQVALVVGGGNIYRGGAGGLEVARSTGDLIGMLATVMNSLVLKESLQQQAVPATVFSAINIDKAAEPFVRERVIQRLESGHVTLLAAGTGNPYFTTDTAAALRCAEIGAEAVLKATKVDGVYDSDPMKNPAAIKFGRISYAEALRRNLKVMDATALSLCMENSIPIIVFKLMERGNLLKCVEGLPVGSIVEKGE